MNKARESKARDNNRKEREKMEIRTINASVAPEIQPTLKVLFTGDRSPTSNVRRIW